MVLSTGNVVEGLLDDPIPIHPETVRSGLKRLVELGVLGSIAPGRYVLAPAVARWVAEG